MSVKKVYCYDVRVPDNYDFSQVLQNPDFHRPVEIGLKKIEIFNVNRDATKRLVSGIFVCTQTKNLPPAHKPGDEDYSAVPLENGQGLAYPNAFLYCEQTKVLLIEYNRYGTTIGNLIGFFNHNANLLNHLDWEIGIEIILAQDAYDRASRITSIKEVTVQVATPQKLISDHTYSRGTLEDIAMLGRDLNGTKSITLSIKGNYNDGGLRKNKLLSILSTLNQIGQKLPTATGSIKNSLLIIGAVDTEDGGSREEVINLFVDRLIGFFPLEDMQIHPHLQPLSRKAGMEQVYEGIKHQILEIIGIRNL
jgi:hypothetical protein